MRFGWCQLIPMHLNQISPILAPSRWSNHCGPQDIFSSMPQLNYYWWSFIHTPVMHQFSHSVFASKLQSQFLFQWSLNQAITINSIRHLCAYMYLWVGKVVNQCQLPGAEQHSKLLRDAPYSCYASSWSYCTPDVTLERCHKSNSASFSVDQIMVLFESVWKYTT